MPKYVALLRGINLRSQVRVSMGDLRRLVADLGHTEVRTHLQSGNVLFTSPPTAPASLAGGIARRISEELGLEVTVLLRGADEMTRVASGNPFLDTASDISLLHVTFLSARPSRAAVGGFEAPPGELARFALVERQVFLYCPQGYGRSKLSNAFIERRLGLAATTRNWRTVTRLHELLSAG